MAKINTSRVNAGIGKSDDYAENLYGGIDQALRDIDECSDNPKMIFVIGDAGYSAVAQQKRGVKSKNQAKNEAPGEQVRRFRSRVIGYKT